ncbi:UNKNOWN [Stylonychia lemnae]|uniref:Uncharacterized protein n=1 Tax=Stylonychia lemnae TaxID=5949 RepID=A0A077ZYJ9_STYLE|nr:UNKNOWN [Stylonychia lemnae]|eukprot:CDW74960.1 UNKNOWN [Stylonychia lemnae]
MQQQQEQRRQSLGFDGKSQGGQGQAFEPNQQTLMLELQNIAILIQLMFQQDAVEILSYWYFGMVCILSSRDSIQEEYSDSRQSFLHFILSGDQQPLSQLPRFTIHSSTLVHKKQIQMYFLYFCQNLQFEFKEWIPGKHWVINILLYIKKLFHLEQMFSLQDQDVLPSNKEAYANYQNNFQEFINQSKACVQKSQDNKFKNPASSMLQFTSYLPVHDKILDQIKQQAKTSKETLKNWFFHNLKEVSNNHNN